MKSVNELKQLAKENRKRIINMIYKAKSGHSGGSLSIIDILTAIYELDVNFSENPRSRVILSKGHTVPAQYAILNSKGIIKDEEMDTLRKINSRLQGHPSIIDIPEVDATTGLLGQGLSIAVGIAIAKKNNNDNHHVYAIVGDGEMQEGQIWEAAMSSNKYKLDNLCVIVDNNNLQIDGSIEEVMSLTNIDEKFKSFGFQIIKIDGHDIDEILKAFEVAKNIKGKPSKLAWKSTK